MPAPSYVSYEPGVCFSHGVPVPIETFERGRFCPDAGKSEAGHYPKNQGAGVPLPQQPDGGIMTREQIDAIMPIIEEHDLFIIADEIYAELTYGRKHVSIA